MSTLRERICAAISSTSERWYSGLAADLAEQGWVDLAGFRIDPSTYGATRVLLADPEGPRRARFLDEVGFGRPLCLERLDGTLRERYGPFGLREPDPRADLDRWAASLLGAMDLIGAAPGAAEAVRTLVWSLTPVATEGPHYDTGYSDPAVPFSIFIGVHPPSDRVTAIRLAEGVLHEAMHLQLTLIEDVVPLIVGEVERRPSPWQGRPRPTQGLLHGLYVFRVVQDWLVAAERSGALDRRDLAHARNRCSQIDEECAELQGLADSLDLTAHGRVLAEALLN